MTAPNEPTLNYGLRYASVFELNADGMPNGEDEVTPYEGLQFKGSTAFELNVPDARKITGLGEDGITQVAFLPPQESMDGRLTCEAADPDVTALLDGTIKQTLGEITVLGGATNKQGFEPQVGLMLYQAAKGLNTGKTYWHHYLIPSAQVVRKPGGMSADKASVQYQVVPNRVTAHLWGTAFSALVEGFSSAQFVEAWTNNPLRIATWLADGIVDDFNFPTAAPAVSTDGILVFVNGVKKTLTTHYTCTTAGVSFVAVPSANDLVVVLREVAG